MRKAITYLFITYKQVAIIEVANSVELDQELYFPATDTKNSFFVPILRLEKPCFSARWAEKSFLPSWLVRKNFSAQLFCPASRAEKNSNMQNFLKPYLN